MSTRIEQISKELAAKKAELKAEKAKVKANNYYYYVVIEGEVVQKTTKAVSKIQGDHAIWTGPKGEKSLSTTKGFAAKLNAQPVISGFMASKISPLLKELGFSYDRNQKAWSK